VRGRSCIGSSAGAIFDWIRFFSFLCPFYAILVSESGCENFSGIFQHGAILGQRGKTRKIKKNKNSNASVGQNTACNDLIFILKQHLGSLHIVLRFWKNRTTGEKMGDVGKMGQIWHTFWLIALRVLHWFSIFLHFPIEEKGRIKKHA